MVGKKPAALSLIIGCQSQYARGRRADFDAASAPALIALNPMPGGSIIPFCELLTVTSTRHSSWR